MKEIQQFLHTFQKEMNWDITTENYEATRASILNNYMLLTTEVSEVAEEFRAIFNQASHLQQAENMEEEAAFEMAKDMHKENIGKELSDCIAYLVKFANYLDIDLEASFYEKMDEVKNRKNKDSSDQT